jgi:hypothetical protein
MPIRKSDLRQIAITPTFTILTRFNVLPEFSRSQARFGRATSLQHRDGARARAL